MDYEREITIPDGFEATINGNKIILTRIESEDERIRKFLIKWIQDNYYHGTTEIPTKTLIAWLEKQGKPELQIDKLPSEMITIGESLGFTTQEECDEYNKMVSDLIMSDDNSEQTPIDKVEPKFKVGDFIVYYYCRGRVVELTNDAYLLDTEQAIPFSFEHNIHLWTINDAKDGDVITCNINKAEIGGDIEKLPNIIPTICIYQNVSKDKDYIHSYCSLYDRSSLILQNTMYYNTFVYDIQPATKEQCDTLFAKIKEAGYEWDDKKKELKEIEQNLEMIEALRTEYEKGRADVIAEMQITWSEEDEKMVNCCKIALEFFEKLGKNFISAPRENYFELNEEKIYPDKINRWLKLLKNRVIPQSKQDWSEEDIYNSKLILATISQDQDLSLDTKDKLTSWFKSLKYRVISCPKQEWSEEDKGILLESISVLQYSGHWVLADKLKSLRPKNHWNPSNEQMDALNDVISSRDIKYDVLSELWNDLNKLKE